LGAKKSDGRITSQPRSIPSTTRFENVSPQFAGNVGLSGVPGLASSSRSPLVKLKKPPKFGHTAGREWNAVVPFLRRSLMSTMAGMPFGKLRAVTDRGRSTPPASCRKWTRPSAPRDARRRSGAPHAAR
jgi:hypothetical protein